MVWRINQGKKSHTVLRDGWAAIAARRASSDPHAATILIIVTQKASGNE
jgi:hypothetical protein